MKKTFKNLSNWCNEHKGIISLMALLVAILALIPFNRLDFNFSDSFIANIILIINYKVSIPIYLVLILLIIILLYLVRIRQRYKSIRIDFGFLVGRWRNEWKNGHTGNEMMEITIDRRCFVNGIHKFNIDNFNYNAKQNQITFTKVGEQPNDTIRLFNKLNINNNELLTGTENDFTIKYTKIN